MSVGNSGEHIAGVAYVKPDADREHMKVFDILPEEVRRAISEARYDFDTRAIARSLRDGRTPAQVATLIRRQDIAAEEAAYEQRGYRP